VLGSPAPVFELATFSKELQLKQRPSIEKRRKEKARQDKKRDKAERRAERKNTKQERDDEPASAVDPDIAHIIPGPQPLPESMD
jgi:hypothetical protein